MRFIHDLARGLLDLVYPPVCAACGRLTDGAAFCDACKWELVTDAFPTCPRCGSTVGAHADVGNNCPRCRTESFAFERVFRMGAYMDLRRDMVLKIKRDESMTERVGAVFAECMAPRLQNMGICAVIATPLHWRRQWQRGYNQSDVLARALARALRVSCPRRRLSRTRSTPHQTALSATARRENVRDAFQARGDVSGTVLLVDDVFTTGSTAHAAATALRRAGAERVLVAVVAHG